MKARYSITGLAVLLLLMGGCAGQSPRPPAMTATAPAVPATAAVTEPAPPAPAPDETAPAAEPAEVATPAPAAPTAGPRAGSKTINIGLEAGDAYHPSSIAIDDGRGIAYVYHSDSIEQRPVISVVDLAGGQVTRLIRLAETTPGGGGRLLVSPDRKQLYLVSHRTRTLTPVNVETGALGEPVTGIHDAVLSVDGRVLYSFGETGLRAHVLADLLDGNDRPLWQIDGARFEGLVLNGGQLLTREVDPERSLVSFDVRTGQEVARAVVIEPYGGLAAGPDGGWAATVTGEKAALIRYDAALEVTGEVAIPYAYELTYDSARQQYLVAGYRPGQDDGSLPVILSLSAGDLKEIAVQEWPDQEAPAAFVPWGSDRLVGFTPSGAARLALLDAASLASEGRIITGVRATDIALEDGSGTLYVSDDHERIHVLKLPEGQEIGLWEGGPSLVLDSANRRLYVDTHAGVRALDMGNGEVVATFSQRGYAAPDPNRDLVYIARRGVTIFDRSGRELGKLDSTFPVEGGLVPNAYAYAAVVNPVSGHVGVVLNNGIPGSNNGSFLRIYPPESDRPIETGSPHSFVQDLTTDRDGNWYVAYGPARGQEGIHVLRSTGQSIRRLDGRTGEMVLDEATGRLYLLLYGSVTSLDLRSLTPLQFYTGPDPVQSVAFSPSRRTLYAIRGSDPRVESIALDALQAIDMRPQSGAPGAEVANEGLAVASGQQASWLLARFGGLYRTQDGKTWEKLPVGIQSTFGYVTTAEPNVVFFAGQGSIGADGIWRSTNAGDTWELLAAGLTDLRPDGPVLARGPDEAYFLNRGQGLLRWDTAGRRWQEAGTKPGDGEWGTLSLAPDGVLFRAGTDLLARSDDKGESWEMLKAPGESGEIIGFTPLYTVTQTLFGAWGDLDRQMLRSRDAGATWEPVTGMIDLTPDYYTPQMVSGPAGIFMLVRSYSNPSYLFHSTDLGETWQVAPPGVAEGVEHVALDPTSGRVWLGMQGGVRSFMAGDLQWLPATSLVSGVGLAPAPSTTPGSVPPATKEPSGLQPTPTAGPCEQPLTGADAELNAEGLGIGCPRGEAVPVYAARQHFENGQMIWREDQKWIYVLYNDGRWEGYADRWLEGDPEDDPALIPPEGLEQPIRGFGRVWRDNLGGAKAPIGWAQEKEQGQTAQIQEWDYGIVLRFGGEDIILLDRGAWR